MCLNGGVHGRIGQWAPSSRSLGRDTEMFLRSISERLSSFRRSTDREWALAVLSEIRHARRFVLNPNAHYDSDLEDEIAAEIAAAIRAVDDFVTLLHSVNRADFAEQTPNDGASVGTLIGNSLELLADEQRAAALDALRRGFGRYLDVLFRSRKELVPYGTDATPRALLLLAGGRHLFDRLTWRLIRHAEPYLVDGIVPKQLDPTAFAVAARLVLRLHVPVLLTKRNAG